MENYIPSLEEMRGEGLGQGWSIVSRNGENSTGREGGGLFGQALDLHESGVLST